MEYIFRRPGFAQNTGVAYNCIQLLRKPQAGAALVAERAKRALLAESGGAEKCRFPGVRDVRAQHLRKSRNVAEGCSRQICCVAYVLHAAEAQGADK